MNASPNHDPFAKWESIIIRVATLILLVIVIIELIAPEIAKLIREIIYWFS